MLRKTLSFCCAKVMAFSFMSCQADSSHDHITSLNNTYTQDYCHQLELAYGDHMMSEGGSAGIENMFQGVPLKDKVLLDFGSGLGGVGVYLAEHYPVRVAGVEINQAMIQEARRRLSKDLKNRVTYDLLKPDLKLPFPNESFDIVYSKGVIVHLSEAQRGFIFEEFNRVLKKEGQLIIYDWLSPTDGKWGPDTEKLIEAESLPLFPFSPKTYKQQLESQGFLDVISEDMSELYGRFNEDVVKRLQSEPVRSEFVASYGEALFEEHLEGYKNIARAHRSGELINMKITAFKK